MATESSFFSGFVVDGLEGFAAYVEDLAKDGTWGDDPEVQALCEIYNRPAEIWAFDPVEGARTIRVFHSGSAGPDLVAPTRPPIRLSYFGGGHYDSLRWPSWEGSFLRDPPGRREEQMLLAAELRRSVPGSAASVSPW